MDKGATERLPGYASRLLTNAPSGLSLTKCLAFNSFYPRTVEIAAPTFTGC